MMGNSVGVVKTNYFSFGYHPEEMPLESGIRLGPITIAYETYGTLNPQKSNAILITHALSADAHAAGISAENGETGWWDNMIGPGKAIDTSRYFVICSNVLGGCKGSTGPSSLDIKTGKHYALTFPVITIADMVKAQKHLIEELGIKKLLCVMGGSMGGMQALQWAASFPEMACCVIPIATAVKHSPQQIAFNEVIRQAIMADYNWCGGNYYEGTPPHSGLALARMIGHITFMSEKSMEDKFSRRLKNPGYSFRFTPDFEVEGYLHYRGNNFVKRFDANSYLYITKAMDYFDLSEETHFPPPATGAKVRFLVISFKSDWLYPPHQSQTIVRLLKRKRYDVTYCELCSNYGHDAFLVDINQQAELISHFLSGEFAKCAS